MDLGFTIYSVIFLVTTLISFFVAYLAWQRRSVKGAKELTLLMIFAGIWTFWIIFETAAHTMSWKVFWSKFEYIGAIITPILYLIFVFRFVGRDKYITKKNLLLLFIIPIVTLLLTFTNEKHNLVWSGYSEISVQTNIMEYYHGPWFWIGYMAYNYLLLILATIYLFIFIVQQNKIFSLQGWLILVAGLCPWVASIIYLVGWNAVPGLDITPLSIVASSILMAYSIFYTRLLDLIPIARETLVETMSDGILVLDKQDRIQDINPAAMGFLGILNKEVLGFHAASCGAEVVNLLNAVIGKDPAAQIDVLVGGENKYYSLIKKAIKTQTGSRLIVIRDITEYKQAEMEVKLKNEQLIKAYAEKDRIFSIIAHDLRGPFSTFLGLTEVLSEDLPGLSMTEIHSFVLSMKNSATNVFFLLENLLNWARSQQGLITFNMERVNLLHVLQESTTIIEDIAKNKEINLKHVFPDNLELFADRLAIQTVIRNLVSNAVKFTPKGGEVTVIANLDSDKNILISVKDNGIGMNKEIKENLFRIDIKTNRKGTDGESSSGLGLLLCKELIEKQGGQIWVESEEGKGSEFYLSIPFQIVTKDKIE